MVTTKAIKVGDEILNLIEKNRKHFRDTPNDILKCLLKFKINKMKGGKIKK